MGMKIEFYDDNATKDVIEEPHDYFILNGNEVWADNNQTEESQCALVGFEDFIRKCNDVGWRVVES